MILILLKLHDTVFSLCHNLHSYEYYIDLDLGVEYQMLWHSWWWHPTRLWAECMRSHGLIPGGGQRFIFTPKCWGQLWGPSILFIRYQELFPQGWSARWEAEYLPPSSAEVKIDWTYTTTPLCAITPCTGTLLLSLTCLISLLLVSWDESVMLKNKKGMFPASNLLWPLVAILREVYYKGWILQDVREPMYRRKILSFDNTLLPYLIAQCTVMDYLKLIKCL